MLSQVNQSNISIDTWWQNLPEIQGNEHVHLKIASHIQHVKCIATQLLLYLQQIPILF